MEELQQYLSVISLLVALLAVVVGPFVSWKIANLQSVNSLRLANKQIVAPIRQAWIDKLRSLLSEYSSICLSNYTMGVYIHDLSLNTEVDHALIEQHVEQRLTILKSEIELLLNPFEEEHKELLVLLSNCLKGLFPHSSHEFSNKFPDYHELLSAQSKKVLKIEWERVKSEL